MTENETETTDGTMLTADEVAVLNAARAICRAYAERLRGTQWKSDHVWRPRTSLYDAGRVSVEAEHADEALFSLLSDSHVWLSYDLTNEQLHNPDHYRPTGRVVPGDLRLVSA